MSADRFRADADDAVESLRMLAGWLEGAGANSVASDLARRSGVLMAELVWLGQTAEAERRAGHGG